MLFLAGPASAATLSEPDRQAVAQVEAYLNGIRTVAANFVQVGPEGQESRGEFYLRRPGRLRFEYMPPVPLLIVADGIWLIMHDTELEQVNRWPVFDTPLAPILARQIVLLGEDAAVEVVGVGRSEDRLDITVVDRESPEEGRLTLQFDRAPLALRGWAVHDTQGGITTVILNTVMLNQELDPALFSFTDPQPLRDRQP
jgi:outer membrane lipoprotein-sorting protein